MLLSFLHQRLITSIQSSKIYWPSILKMNFNAAVLLKNSEAEIQCNVLIIGTLRIKVKLMFSQIYLL